MPTDPYAQSTMSRRNAADASAAAGVKKDDAANAPTDPYAHPTSFVGFGQQYDANAGTAKAAAGSLASTVGGAVNGANRAVGDDYARFIGSVKDGTSADPSFGAGADGVLGYVGGYSGPDAYAQGDDAHGKIAGAQNSADLLGSDSGVQTLLGPGSSMFGAALAHHAGGPQFGAIQRDAKAVTQRAAGNERSGTALVDKAHADEAARRASYDADQKRLTDEWHSHHARAAGSPAPEPTAEDLYEQQMQDDYVKSRGSYTYPTDTNHY